MCKATLKFLARYTTIKEQHQINEEIRDKEVRVISAEGEQLGIMSASAALQLAEEADLDLVVISPNQAPPVAKILNYGKYKYELEKKAKEAKKKQAKIEVKEIQLSVLIDVNDFNTKANQTKKFLTSGNKVKVSVNKARREAIMKNHTAAHLLQAALREVLGTHVEQAGQLVNENAVRFDFSHFEAMTAEELSKVEAMVNEKILEGLSIEKRELQREIATLQEEKQTYKLGNMIAAATNPILNEVEALNETVRGAGGFGSTGTK